MRRHLTVTGLCAALVLQSAMAWAGDQNVPTNTLQRLGLSGMQLLSDEEGMHIRGMSDGNAFARGISTVSLLVLDPDSGSHVSGIDGSNALATSVSGGGAPAQAAIRHQSNVAVTLSVTTPTSFFTGTIIGGAGGTASASSH